VLSFVRGSRPEVRGRIEAARLRHAHPRLFRRGLRAALSSFPLTHGGIAPPIRGVIHDASGRVRAAHSTDVNRRTTNLHLTSNQRGSSNPSRCRQEYRSAIGNL